MSPIVYKECGMCGIKYSKDFNHECKRSPEPASNEEIERRIQSKAIEHANIVSDPEWEDFYGRELSFRLGAQWMRSLASELKAQKPEEFRVITKEDQELIRKVNKQKSDGCPECEDIKEIKCDCTKSINESLEVDKLKKIGNSSNILQNALKEEYNLGYSHGELKAWRDAIARLECAQGLNGRDVLNLKDEAKHRGIKL
jgi:hypothetical protein